MNILVLSFNLPSFFYGGGGTMMIYIFVIKNKDTQNLVQIQKLNTRASRVKRQEAAILTTGCHTVPGSLTWNGMRGGRGGSLRSRGTLGGRGFSVGLRCCLGGRHGKPITLVGGDWICKVPGSQTLKRCNDTVTGTLRFHYTAIGCHPTLR